MFSVNTNDGNDSQPTQADTIGGLGEKFENEMPFQKEAKSSMKINIDTSHIKHPNSSFVCEDAARTLIGSDDANANASHITNELHYGHDEIIDQNEEAEESEVKK